MTSVLYSILEHFISDKTFRKEVVFLNGILSKSLSIIIWLVFFVNRKKNQLMLFFNNDWLPDVVTVILQLNDCRYIWYLLIM